MIGSRCGSASRGCCGARRRSRSPSTDSAGRPAPEGTMRRKSSEPKETTRSQVRLAGTRKKPTSRIRRAGTAVQTSSMNTSAIASSSWKNRAVATSSDGRSKRALKPIWQASRQAGSSRAADAAPVAGFHHLTAPRSSLNQSVWSERSSPSNPTFVATRRIRSAGWGSPRKSRAPLTSAPCGRDQRAAPAPL